MVNIRREKMTNNDQNNKKPANEGGRWIGIGIALGAGLGVALDNIGLGIGLGLAFGAAIGAMRSHRSE
jgi:F0F1-type ATP synthase membrane subunit c/vacuolar-type H+-ATPase subunit K